MIFINRSFQTVFICQVLILTACDALPSRYFSGILGVEDASVTTLCSQSYGEDEFALYRMSPRTYSEFIEKFDGMDTLEIPSREKMGSTFSYQHLSTWRKCNPNDGTIKALVESTALAENQFLCYDKELVIDRLKEKENYCMIFYDDEKWIIYRFQLFLIDSSSREIILVQMLI